ncbi:MAG TPA: DSD1 family PLP-dependent enzyme [Planctomycetaceae bacterium]|nr:DSD1 family PLP-dependent enzyme [Planctomycetaceae bacterium]HIQ20788.1 DSD1 family PLP-dependent enzyme [Planctomycetota bacterium]
MSVAHSATDDVRRWVGLPITELDTPVLLLDGEASQRNIRRMAGFFHGKKARLRPHFKNHKCPALARRQWEAGSVVGFTCAKLGEAEVLAAHGFDNLLLANQVVGREKLARLVRLATRIDIRVAVDHAEQLAWLSQAATEARVTLGVLVEVDIGMGRCGVPPGQPAIELARQAVALPGLRFVGLQAYEGHLVYADDPEERRRRTVEAFQGALQTRRALEQEGIPVEVISGGSSSTYQTTGSIDGVDEIQAGSYATMDWRYAQLAPEFEVALSVLTRVISRSAGRAVLDVGLKGATADFGPPRIKGNPDVEIPRFLSEEHCVVHRAPEWPIGQPLELIPSHCCTTCNLYRHMFVHEGGRVVDVWPIEASGRLT